jgi:hypothetical protein
MCYQIEMEIFFKETIKETGINATEINGIQEIKLVFQMMCIATIQIATGPIKWKETNNKCNALNQGHNPDPVRLKEGQHQGLQAQEGEDRIESENKKFYPLLGGEMILR